MTLSRLRQHIVSSSKFCGFQSAYRAAHSTETALLRVVNDLVISACNKRASVLIALDISAAFDTIDHDIICRRADSDFGIRGLALAWMRSFVSGRSSCVSVGGTNSPVTFNSTGVPQGSVLRPMLFALYTSPVSKIIAFSITYMQMTRSYIQHSNPAKST